VTAARGRGSPRARVPFPPARPCWSQRAIIRVSHLDRQAHATAEGRQNADGRAPVDRVLATGAQLAGLTAGATDYWRREPQTSSWTAAAGPGVVSEQQRLRVVRTSGANTGARRLRVTCRLSGCCAQRPRRCRRVPCAVNVDGAQGPCVSEVDLGLAGAARIAAIGAVLQAGPAGLRVRQ
jgi:hypothetical protein